MINLKALKFSPEEMCVIDAEINKLEDMGVITKTQHCKGEFISNIFITPTKDGSFRLILNLKRLMTGSVTNISKWKACSLQ